nr:HAD domain-containing protein [Acidovorax sp. 100]
MFLDFDGVLHPEFCHESRHFSCLSTFEQALRVTPNCEVVITSTWRLYTPLDSLRSRFSSDIAPRIIGATGQFGQLESIPDTLLGYEREAECIAWLRANGRAASPWLAVDDRSWLFRPFNRSVFLIDGRTGLTMDKAEELITRLRNL